MMPDPKPSTPSLDSLFSGVPYPPVPVNYGANFTPTTRLDTYPYLTAAERRNCAGKRVLITGGNKGIGLGIALAYARAGASHIAITSRNPIDEDILSQIRAAAPSTLTTTAPDVLALRMDVTSPSSVQLAASTLKSHFNNRLDIVISNAGFLARYDRLLESDDEEWWRSFEVNLRGGYLVAKAFVPVLLGTQGGDRTFISMSSTGALHFHPGGSSYQISKFALLRLVEFLLAEYKDQGLLAYSIHPGGVATDLSDRLPESTKSWLVCTPALGGDTIAFLTSERQEWLAGRYLSAMWDMDEFFAKKQDIIDRDLLKMRLTF
ncbi:hypothetical protein F4777DRAFT_572097 [Nemania sp. FL0916]|nr:hypothetical protein F4777DRAFT_572097 [Nemania sp. FL0916]